MMSKIIFIAIEILVIFGMQCIHSIVQIIKIELLNSLAKQYIQLMTLIYYINIQLINN